VDEQALERAKRRIAEGRAGRADALRFEAALDRSREQVEALARAAEELEAGLPERVGAAVQEGLRREVVPVGRTLAELRGLVNQANRRLERIEQELLAERHARVDDLALLVDLVTSGWQGVDDRLRRLEQSTAGAKVVPLQKNAAA
jgi:hypothetical protein